MSKTCEIPLTRGYVAIVDAADYDWLMQFKWQWSCGYASHSKRVAGRKNAVAILMHRMIVNPLPGFEIDHINGDRLDNRRCNLRICTSDQNRQNKSRYKNNTSGYKGVLFHKPMRKWLAQIKVNNQVINLGYFAESIEAARAYDAAALKHFGAFARLNFPPTRARAAAARTEAR